jgi:hypothetical protein
MAAAALVVGITDLVLRGDTPLFKAGGGLPGAAAAGHGGGDPALPALEGV